MFENRVYRSTLNNSLDNTGWFKEQLEKKEVNEKALLRNGRMNKRKA